MISFYISSSIAVVATGLVLFQRNAVHALLYLILSFLAVALVFYQIGAPLIAALEVIIYAGAIIVLFVFAIMIMNPRLHIESRGIQWVLPVLLAVVLLIDLMMIVTQPAESMARAISPGQVSRALFGPYLIGIELISILLLSALVGAFHLGRREEGG